MKIKRFSAAQRLFHLLLMLSFVTQAATGLARMYIETAWGRSLVSLFGGYEGALEVHKTVGLFMIALFLAHIIYLLFIIDWRRFPESVYGPDSLLPRPEDLGQALQHTCWIAGISRLSRIERWQIWSKLHTRIMKTRLAKFVPHGYLKKIKTWPEEITTSPRFDRWTYWEKFDFWAVFWGMVIIGGTGLIMAYPLISTRFMPGWGLNIALWIHRLEAILAMGHVFLIHFFIGHLRPHNFPMDLVMFEGTVDLNNIYYEKPAWAKRLKSKGISIEFTARRAPKVFRVFYYVFGYLVVIGCLYLLINGLVHCPDITW